MALQDAIETIQAHARGLSGIKAAPDYAPESLNQFPFAVSYARQGQWIRESSWKKGLHTILTEIHVSRGLLPKAIELAMPYCESFPNAVWNDPTLNGNCDTVIDIRYTFGALDWGGEESVNIGWRFEIDIKQQSGLS